MSKSEKILKLREELLQRRVTYSPGNGIKYSGLVLQEADIERLQRALFDAAIEVEKAELLLSQWDTFKQGQRVRKSRGSEWHGKVVGVYSTALTPEGYCVESERERGSVQLYPVTALEPEE